MAGIAMDVRRLRKAIGRDEFRLVYQPKADLRTGSIVGVEALARWDAPRRGAIAPAEFVAQAERSGSAIQAFTEWTLEAAFAQARAWQRQGQDLTVPVWRRLSALGCDVAQGNYLSPPLPPDELTAWVRQWEELYAEAHRMADELLERRDGPDDRRFGPSDRRLDGRGDVRFVAS